MTWLISSWISLGLKGFGAGSVFLDPPSSSVEQKSKLVPFSLSFPIKNWYSVRRFNAKQKPLQQKEGTHTFYLVGAAVAGVVMTLYWQLFTWDNPNKILFHLKILMREGSTGVNLTPGGNPLFWAFLVVTKETWSVHSSYDNICKVLQTNRSEHL